MRMDSEMIGILLSDSMHYTIVVSLEMSDEPKFCRFTVSVVCQKNKTYRQTTKRQNHTVNDLERFSPIPRLE